MRQFLGLDSSTQSLSAIVVDLDTGETVLDAAANFGDVLPAYESPAGFLANPDPLVRHADPLMWVEALDYLFEKCRADGFDWGNIRGISGSGQQHGTVYLKPGFSDSANWDSGQPLVDQVRPLLTRQTSPIWMDSSTTAECRELATAVGGDAYVVSVTGSRPIERFPASQIRKLHKIDPDTYEATGRIYLVSSFMAFLLSGRDVPIDFGDGAGMNLLNLAAGTWDPKMLDAAAPGLADKLPPAAASNTVTGELAPYFCEKYGFAGDTPVIAWSGDNPCSLIGMGGAAPGSAIISLSTSDTFFGAMRAPRTDPKGYGHVFGNPAGGFMSLICFKNGSLTREHVANRVGMDWDAFSSAILDTAPGNNGNFMLPYIESEITPVILEPQLKLIGDGDFTAWRNPAAAARGIVEAQALSMRLHATWIDETPETLLATGGASRNRGILQVFADVFGARVQTIDVSNSAALGAALRAAHACTDVDWPELFANFAAPAADIAVLPAETNTVYADLTERFLAELHTTYGV